MTQQTLDRIANVPVLWNVLRWIAEAGYTEHHRAIREAFDPKRPDDRRFLDFGCGTGQFAADFPVDRYTGFDLTRPYVAFAGRNRRGDFAVMDGTRTGFQDHSFDAALVLGVLHHLPDNMARDCLAELSRVLKPGGKLLVIEDVPPPTIWNIPGHLMHWLDRGDNIRTDADYQRLWSALFTVGHAYEMRSGICDYRVYELNSLAS